MNNEERFVELIKYIYKYALCGIEIDYLYGLKKEFNSKDLVNLAIVYQELEKNVLKISDLYQKLDLTDEEVFVIKNTYFAKFDQDSVENIVDELRLIATKIRIMYLNNLYCYEAETFINTLALIDYLSQELNFDKINFIDCLTDHFSNINSSLITSLLLYCDSLTEDEMRVIENYINSLKEIEMNQKKEHNLLSLKKVSNKVKKSS